SSGWERHPARFLQRISPASAREFSFKVERMQQNSRNAKPASRRPLPAAATILTCSASGSCVPKGHSVGGASLQRSSEAEVGTRSEIQGRAGRKIPARNFLTQVYGNRIVPAGSPATRHERASVSRADW